MNNQEVPADQPFSNGEREVSKAEFRKLYFQYGTPENGWTAAYWDRFFEGESGMRYFFAPPTPGQTEMCISSGGSQERLFFLSENALEWPGGDSE